MKYSRYSKIAGISMNGRQRLAKNCVEGQRLTLIRDAFNKFDKNAIAIYSGEDQIGFIKKELAAELAPVMDAGTAITCTVTAVTGQNSQLTGVNILLEYEDQRNNTDTQASGYVTDKGALVEMPDSTPVCFTHEDDEDEPELFGLKGDNLVTFLRNCFEQQKEKREKSIAPEFQDELFVLGKQQFVSSLTYIYYGCRKQVRQNPLMGDRAPEFSLLLSLFDFACRKTKSRTDIDPAYIRRMAAAIGMAFLCDPEDIWWNWVSKNLFNLAPPAVNSDDWDELISMVNGNFGDIIRQMPFGAGAPGAVSACQNPLTAYLYGSISDEDRLRFFSAAGLGMEDIITRRTR